MTRRALALAFLCSTAFSCAAPAYADTTRDRMPQIYTMTPMGVNIQSGTFVLSETDFTIGSLSFVRSWRSVPSAQVGGAPSLDHHRFGAWNHNYGFAARWHPTINDGVEIFADGKVYQFRWNSISSNWQPWNLDQHNNNAFGAQLTGTVGINLGFRNQNGDVYTFNGQNQATSVVYADGGRLDLVYDGSNRLDTILSNRGDAIVLDYNGSGLITAACGFNRALVHVALSRTCSDAAPNAPHVKVSYGYTSTTAAQGWNLTAVTGADNVVTQMTYDNYFRPNLLCVTLPGASPSPTGCRVTNVYGPTAQNQNYLPDQVNKQTSATGEVWLYEYVGLSQYQDWPPLQPGEVRLTSSHMTDPLGRPTTAEYENGFLKHLYVPEGHSQYGWTSLNPTQFTLPGGNVDSLVYDLRSNLTSRTRQAAPNSGDAAITTSATFHASVPSVFPTGCSAASQRLCNKPITTTDANGNVTDYEYDAAHGGVLTVTRPAPSTGAVRPQTRYTYTQLYAGVRNSSGMLENASAPVWVLTQESECRTQTSCSGTSDEVRTVYHYGNSGDADALRLRGRTVTDNTTSHRTCFTYDAVGNRISETGPGAQLASCPAQ